MKVTHTWLLLTATSGLVNVNAKWQNQSDDVMFDPGMTQPNYVRRQFYKKKSGKLLLVVARIVNDLKVAGVDDNGKSISMTSRKRFELGTESKEPGMLSFVGISTV